MEIELTKEQWKMIDQAAKTHPNAHIRARAMAIRAVALGHSRREVSQFFPFTPYSIGQFVQVFREEGLEGFEIGEGRGRHSMVDDEEVLSRLRCSPQNFGIDQTRWTLKALGKACPSLSGMSDQGILNVLKRLGFHYKRGQPWIHSPDPQYEEKKTPSKPRTKRRERRKAG